MNMKICCYTHELGGYLRMKKGLLKMYIFFWVFFIIIGNAVDSFAKYEFGNIILEKHEKEMKREKVDMAVFPHWIHVLYFKCKACHNDPFIPEDGANDITMKEINNGKECGLCHNGNTAFSQKECKRCHSLSSDETSMTLKTDAMTKRLYPGIFTTKLRKGKEKKNKHLKFADPKDVSLADLKAIADRLDVQFNLKYFEENGFPRNRIKTIDYKKLVLGDRVIIPRDSVPGKEKKEEKIRDNFIVFEVLSDFVDSIAFPHNKHSYMVNCDTCHEKVFKSELGSNLIHMREISAGKFCGYCHNRVSFPLAICTNCHKVPKGTKISEKTISKYYGNGWPGEILVRKNPLKGKKLSVSTKRGEGLSIGGEKTKEDIEREKREVEMVKRRREEEKQKSRIESEQKAMTASKQIKGEKASTKTTAKTSLLTLAREKKRPASTASKSEPLTKSEPVVSETAKTEKVKSEKVTMEEDNEEKEYYEDQQPKKGGCLFKWF